MTAMPLKTTRVANLILIIVLSVAGLYFAAAFLIPIILAALLAMLLTRGSGWLERFGINRALSSLIPLLLFIGTVVLIGFILYWQINRFTDNFGDMRQEVSNKVDTLRKWVSDTFGIAYEEQEQLLKQQQEKASSKTGNVLMAVVDTLASIAFNTVLVMVYTYLFVYYRSHLKKFVLRIVPETKRQHANEVVHKSATVSSRYLAGLFNMVAILWVMYGIGFTIVGLEGAIIFAIICGVLEIVPFFGNFVGNVIAILAVLAQGGDAGMVLAIVAVYLVIQFLQTYFLETLVVGQKVNINPLFIIIGLVAGELLWGIAGMALAIPVLGIVKIICDNIPELHAYGQLIGPANIKKDKATLMKLLKKKQPKT
ncbi:AI-2E family transporter [Parapedobacter deserti]|uniref:AI-2E family transporter n=1 Tax=Parapedobacter deserti TaxID=1912957 RepID=A0ABV7JQE6_9SPHI